MESWLLSQANSHEVSQIKTSQSKTASKLLYDPQATDKFVNHCVSF